MSLPKPNQEESLEYYLKVEWEFIIKNWQQGWIIDSKLRSLEQELEFQRKEVFEKKNKNADFDWEGDWLSARELHDDKLDYVNNQKKYFNDLREMWMEYQRLLYSQNSELRIESLKAMVLVTGAAIIVSISVLTGDISKMPSEVLFAAKSTIFISSISLIMTAIGHSMSAEFNTSAASTIRGVLVGYIRQNRLRAIHRYIRRYIEPNLNISQYFIYGAIGLFGFNALVSALVLISI